MEKEIKDLMSKYKAGKLYDGQVVVTDLAHLLRQASQPKPVDNPKPVDKPVKKDK